MSLQCLQCPFVWVGREFIMNPSYDVASSCCSKVQLVISSKHSLHSSIWSLALVYLHIKVRRLQQFRFSLGNSCFNLSPMSSFGNGAETPAYLYPPVAHNTIMASRQEVSNPTASNYGMMRSEEYEKLANNPRFKHLPVSLQAQYIDEMLKKQEMHSIAHADLMDSARKYNDLSFSKFKTQIKNHLSYEVLHR